MMESLGTNSLVLSGLWVATSLLMLLVWGLLAWAVVSILSRQEFGRRRAGASSSPSHCGPEKSDDAARTRQPDQIRPPRYTSHEYCERL